MLLYESNVMHEMISVLFKRKRLFARCAPGWLGLMLTCAVGQSATITFDLSFVDTPAFAPQATYELKYKNGAVDVARFTSSTTYTHSGTFLLDATNLPDGSVWNEALLDLDKGFTSTLMVTSAPPGAPSLQFEATRTVNFTNILVGGVAVPITDGLELTMVLSPAQFDNQPIALEWASQVVFSGPLNSIPSGTGNKHYTYTLTENGSSWAGARLTGSYTEFKVNTSDTFATPEPASFALLGGGLVIVAAARRIRRRA